MNRASPATGWVRNPVMKSPKLDPIQASSYELGWTYNPLTGCRNHTAEGLCLGGLFPCYAYRLANGRLRERYLANEDYAPVDVTNINMIDPADDPFYPRFWEDRLFQPFNDKHISQKGIFACDMSDLFGIGIPEEWTKAVMDVIEDCPTDRFYLLTKQPQNLTRFSPFPENCFVGVTATDYKMFSFALEFLKDIKAQVKYISIEPMLDRLNIPLLNEVLINCGINWLVIGAQTKPTKYPPIEAVREIVEAADKAGIPVFLKDNLLPMLKLKGFNTNIFWKDKRDVKGFEDLHFELRQEIPK